MVALAFLATLLPLLSLSSALHNPNSPPHLRHRRIANAVEQIRDSHPGARAIENRSGGEAHADAHRMIKRVVQKRGKTCRPRGSSPDLNAVQATSTSTAAPSATSSAVANQEAWAHKSQADSASTKTSSQPSSTSSASWSESTGTPGGGWSNLLAVNDPTCGPCGATEDSPNGSEGWLNCGVDGGGWTPPMIKLNQVVHGSLNANGIFSPCSDHIDLFNQKGQQYGIPGIMLASFAMQESTCNPGATGGNGEAGLMQLTHENCHGAPGGNCYDIDFNIGRGAELFSSLIDKFDGNVVSAVGYYNGWSNGLTVGSATAAASQGRCTAQNNLDYLHQFFNGWLQGKNAYSMGTYFNLAHC